MVGRDKNRPVVGVEDAFGARAKSLRQLQNRLLNLFSEADYEEVIPPFVERQESMNAGAGRFLTDQTMVFSDPAGAGLLAIRSDMTPQIARIAATRMQGEKDLRLCYSGTVMQARPDSRTGSRQQWQTGIERMGDASMEADVEVMHLAAMAMHAAGFNKPVLQVGHIGLLKALIGANSKVGLDELVQLLGRRSPEDMRHYLSGSGLGEAQCEALATMAAGLADQAWLEKVGASLGKALGKEFTEAAERLLQLSETLQARLSGEVEVQINAATMTRFLYHSGIIFAGFSAGAAQALLFGGRYDSMMKLHGRDMPATGFSFDLWSWLDAGANGEV